MLFTNVKRGAHAQGDILHGVGLQEVRNFEIPDSSFRLEHVSEIRSTFDADLVLISLFKKLSD